MGRFNHWALALILLGTTVCTSVHAEMPKNSPGMANCPYHQSGQDEDSRSAPASQQDSRRCQDCLTTNFISESKTSHEMPSAGQIILPAALVAEITELVSLSVLLTGYEFTNFTAYRVIRI